MIGTGLAKIEWENLTNDLQNRPVQVIGVLEISYQRCLNTPTLGKSKPL